MDRLKCNFCGYRFGHGDMSIMVHINGEYEYVHEDCLKETSGMETLENFGIEMEEVEQ